MQNVMQPAGERAQTGHFVNETMRGTHPRPPVRFKPVLKLIPSPGSTLPREQAPSADTA